MGSIETEIIPGKTSCDVTIQTIQTMEDTLVCADSDHLHSFQQISFSLLSSLRKCACCDERLKPVLFGGNTSVQIVRCVACGVVAHRSCSSSKAAVWKEKCPVNHELIQTSTLTNSKRNLDSMLSSSFSFDQGTEGEEEDIVNVEALPENCSVIPTTDEFTTVNPPAEAERQKVAENHLNDAAGARQRALGMFSNVQKVVASKLPFRDRSHVEGKQSAKTDEDNAIDHKCLPFSNVAKVLQENILEHFRKRSSSDIQDSKDDDSYVDATTGEAPRRGITIDRLGTAAVVGGIAGGVAGLAFAGPAVAMVGAFGAVAESSVSVGILVAGVATGSATAKQIQERLAERRVLTMGEEGAMQKILLVRPSVAIDPVWEEITASARSTLPQQKAFFGGLRFRKQNPIVDGDIVQTDEGEIPTADKILLLVSRLLNDKSSLPGHVYRELIQAFRQRCAERGSASGRTRRDDLHAVIKHVTATLLEVRAEFASSPAITERTASAVESLVFGQLYTLVWDEVMVEAASKDEDLLRKVMEFNNEKGQDYFPYAHLSSASDEEGIISKPALHALRQLPHAHTAVDKLSYCVEFLERISEHFSACQGRNLSAESLLLMVCKHLWICLSVDAVELHAQITFLEEFARDEQLLRGREGYSLVTLQAAIHFLDMSTDLDHLFQSDDDWQVS